MYLFAHIWKSFIRNERWRRNLITGILFVFVGIYFILLFAGIGFNLSSSLAKEGGAATGKFHEWILWYLLADYLVRCFVQPVPSLEVIPYLRFRTRRRKLAQNIILRSGLSLFNFLPLFLIIPFIVLVVEPSHGPAAALFFMTGSVLLIIQNNMLALLTGMLTRINHLFWLIPAGIAALFALLHSMNGSVNVLSRALGHSMTEGDILTFIIILVLIIAAVRIIVTLLHHCLRVDRKTKQRQLKTTGQVLTGRLGRFGDTGRYLSLELSMILRNRRPRNTMLIVLFFLVYAVVYYLFLDEEFGRYTNMLFTTMFLGLGAMSYGQLLFSWESTYFDGIMARKNNFLNYLKTKYYLQFLITLILYVPVSILAVASGKMSFLTVTAIMLFLTGPNTFITMMLATLNDGKIDLDAGTFMNYQGVKGSQFVMTFLFVLIPIVIYKVTDLVAGDTGGTIVLAALGIIFIVTHEWWLKHVVSVSLMKRKYKLLEGYRKLSA